MQAAFIPVMCVGADPCVCPLSNTTNQGEHMSSPLGRDEKGMRFSTAELAFIQNIRREKKNGI